jgi:hypothetical protein
MHRRRLAPQHQILPNKINKKAKGSQHKKGEKYMKIITVVTIIFGTLLFVGGSAGIEVGKLLPKIYICSIAEEHQKEIEREDRDYELAKPTGQEKMYAKHRESQISLLEEYETRCDEKKAIIKFRSAICSYVAGLGFLLLVIGFCFRRGNINSIN